MNDTQRRRNIRNDGSDRKRDTTDKIKSQKPNMGYFQTRTVKQCVIIFICFVVMYKVFQMYWYSGPVLEEPPDPADLGVVSWIHTHNPQGMTEDTLKELVDEIDADHYDPQPSPRMDLEAPEIVVKGKPYVSTGSLTFKNRQFLLQRKPFRMISGAMHYFRVVPEYWEDRMRKMKACGVNTLETYVPWNLHEDTPGNFNFKGILDLRRYIQLAQKVGLYVIFRPGPYICSEWDFGGLPAWLLKDEKMKVRSNYHGYTSAVERYFNKLLPLVTDLQFKNGGPIIAVQIENEFGSYSKEVEHLMFLKKLMVKKGIEEMFFTSDGIVGGVTTGLHNAPFYTEALPTINYKVFGQGKILMDFVKDLGKDFPLVVMEFWSGWFDHWGEGIHSTSNTDDMTKNLHKTLRAGASVNLYMFHGGTNFGFMSGANWFQNSPYKSDVTSYDYVAPLSESGDITPKFEVARALFKQNANKEVTLPDLPPNTFKAAYGTVTIENYLPLHDMLTPIKPIRTSKPVPMEMLDLHNGYGQNYGFILYRTHVTRVTKIKFTEPVFDRVQVLMNGVELELPKWFNTVWEVPVPSDMLADENILDILVENTGRVNYVHIGSNRLNEERKGISGDVMMYEKGKESPSAITEWNIYPLELKEDYISSIQTSKKWKPFVNWIGPTALYSATLTIEATPRDTFIRLKRWKKGVVFINGFNLGRYWDKGPQKTLFVPAPILKAGKNKIVIFELHKASHSVVFQNYPML